jgi:TonB-linked SusC/RagA family outer membrane protein
MLVFVLYAWAQDRTVSGKVTDADSGEGLPGVNVLLKGTGTGVNTDLDGNYKISVPSDGGTLVFSFIGMTMEEVAIGSRSVIDIQMESDVQQLSEVVVTALGQERERRSLGYAVTSLSEEQLERRSEPDIGRILNGKVPGVNITPTTGLSGTGTSIVIRGFSSISGSNQPLFIVDGAPFNTNTNTQGGFTGGGVNATSRFLDIDPNNIASIEVLKGLAATVKYGEQGRNGVILVTTKGGRAGYNKKPFQITFTQSAFINEIASLPEFQDSYGNGFHNSYGPFFSNWGAPFSSRDSVPHPYGNFSDPALQQAFSQFVGQQLPYQAFPGPEGFFQRGTVSNSSINVSANTERSSVNATFSYNDETGFVPNNTLERINFGIGSNTQLSDRLNLSSSVAIVSTDTKSPPLGASTGSGAVGDGAALFANVLYTPRNIPLMDLPFESPIDGRSVYYRGGNDIPNPRWLAEYTRTTSETQRYTLNQALSYDILDNLVLTYRISYDNYNESQSYLINKGIGPGVANANLNLGLYRTQYIKNTIWNQDFALAYNGNITEDLGYNVSVGAQIRNDSFERDGLESTEQVAFNFVEHGNFVNPSSTNSFTGGDIQARQYENLYGAYYDFTLDYKRFLYVNLVGRNDWSSTVEPANQSQFYPSFSVSFLPTTAIAAIENSTILNELKIRASYATAAGFPSPYSTRSLLGSSARAFVANDGSVIASNSTANRLGNPNLAPELFRELELGIEAQLFKNRLGIDLTLYDRTTDGLITDVPLDPATGFTVTETNAGVLGTQGLELGLTGTLVATKDFNWVVRGNFATYESIVESLADGVEVIDYAGFIGFASNAAIAGQPYGAIRTTVVERTANGDPIVNSNGDYLIADDVAVTGDPNPDFTTSLINSVSWKGFTLGAQLDYRHGGDVFSVTAGAVVGRGLAKSTDFDRLPTVILTGVRQDGVDGEGQPVYVENDIQITSTDAYFNNIGFGPGEFRIFDGSTIRLREVSLGYALPKSILEKTPIKGLSLTLSGNNLWFLAYNFPTDLNFDTEVAGTGVGNGLGLDFLTGPSGRRYGATLQITF